MTTARIYVGGTAGISPAAAADWGNTASMVRFAANTTKPNLSSANITSGSLSNTLVALLQVVYPLTAGMKFTSGVDTIRGYFISSRGTGSGDNDVMAGARIIASDGTTVRATLLTPENPGAVTANAIISTTPISRRYPRAGTSNTVGATYTAVSGDYLVMELGHKPYGTSHTSIINRHSVTGSTDLAGNETDTNAALCPWIEFTYTTAVDESATVSSGTITLTGQALTAGRVTADATVATQAGLTLTGQSVVARLPYTAGMTKADLTLTGQALTKAAADGYATVATQAAMTLTGQDVQANWDAPDTVVLSRATLTMTGKALTGASAEVSPQILTGTLTLTGQDVVGGASVGAIASQGVITLTGQSVSAAAILAAIVSQGSLTLTGRDVAISSASATTAITRGQLTFTGTVVVVRQGFSFYQVHII